MVFFAIKDTATCLYLDDFGSFTGYLVDAMYFFTKQEAQSYINYEELFDCVVVKCVVKEVWVWRSFISYAKV